MTRAAVHSLVLLCAVAALSWSCASRSRDAKWAELTKPPKDESKVLSFMGTVRHLDLEGGLYVIRDAKGAQYQPTNLPKEFQRDGAAVEVEAQRRDETASIGMAGAHIELIRIRETQSPAAKETGLPGSSWLLVDLGGAAMVPGTTATLTFTESGTAEGSTSCNRFTGSVTIRGESIQFGHMATMRQACADAVMEQSNQFLEALRKADHYEIQESFLLLHGSTKKPMRFARSK
jgi:heat shock protein HslJ